MHDEDLYKFKSDKHIQSRKLDPHNLIERQSPESAISSRYTPSALKLLENKQLGHFAI
jgi:hypothetical protein